MARPNLARSIDAEANLARRIERERNRRGLSYEALSKDMTAIGCSINASSIYKIEKGDPPRRVTVDELVALTRVFETTMEDLLTPVEVLDQRRAQELLASIDTAEDALVHAIAGVLEANAELFALRDTELNEYVHGHLVGRGAPTSVTPGPTEALSSELRTIVSKLYLALIKEAHHIAGDGITWEDHDDE
ncbi:helix-turn-helix domain-containing protein [Mumia zhuanghuii]|uniref:Helix-turn-helix domain-containing protein n=2 Tax=Mumia TaxID=1546255 RepID=A0ABW1QT76_9ACTN|nr:MULTISPECIES: helix-turn-helix transcriptional regulator [Mumia]KAA1422496.1 helix-turn-helix domain-containing protein [Mumia zhuanghuii]